MPSVYDNLDYPHGDEHRWVTYTCPWCSKVVSGLIVASATSGTGEGDTAWTRCPSCLEGALVRDELFGHSVYPPVPFGPDIVGLPQDVKDAYTEARYCIGVRAYTAAELVCRKILMHIAVDKGAKEGQKFAAYLTYLESAGYVTPPMKGWVELIRKHGNVATHELPSTNRQRAASTVMFTAELLRLVYEMEHMAQQYAAKPNGSDSSAG
jgi:Domain of unknown function (DUF4145)